MNTKMMFVDNGNELIERFNSQVRSTIKEEFINSRTRFSKKSNDMDKYLTRREVCRILRISSSTLHRWVNNGILKCYKVGRRSLFKKQEIETTLITLNVEGGTKYGY